MLYEERRGGNTREGALPLPRYIAGEGGVRVSNSILVVAVRYIRPPEKGAANDSERGFAELNPPAFGHPLYTRGTNLAVVT
jgi:hypothetical protein